MGVTGEACWTATAGALGPLLIVGASARAAATSIGRAAVSLPGDSGFRLFAADLFGDLDLQQQAVTHRMGPGQFPAAAVGWSGLVPKGLWLYTGGLENYPDVVDTISQRHRLLGCCPDTLRRVRDPFCLSATLCHAGLPYLRVARTALEAAVAGGAWLRKPRGSCGGLSIHEATVELEGLAGAEDHPTDVYYQQRADGRAHSGWFVANGQTCRCLGSVRSWKLSDLELPGVALAGDQPFAYAGSLGPLRPPSRLQAHWQRLGEVCTRAFQLRGLFGMDALVDADGTLWPTEINPRFTASMELLDLCRTRPVMGLHLDACLQSRVPGHTPPAGSAGAGWPRVAAKAIVYASRDCRMPRHAALRQWLQRRGAAALRLADLPAPGSPLTAGQPVLSLLATGEAPRRVASRLGLVGDRGIWQQLQRELHFGTLFPPQPENGAGAPGRQGEEQLS